MCQDLQLRIVLVNTHNLKWVALSGNSLLTERQRSIVRQLDSIHKDMNRIYDTGDDFKLSKKISLFKHFDLRVFWQNIRDFTIQVN